MANTTGKKYGGREKGTPNKTTSEIREAFQLLISSKTDDFGKWIDEIAKEDKVKAFDIIIKISDFVIPKLQRTEVKADLTIHNLIEMPPEQRRERILELQTELKKV